MDTISGSDEALNFFIQGKLVQVEDNSEGINDSFGGKHDQGSQMCYNEFFHQNQIFWYLVSVSCVECFGILKHWKSCLIIHVICIINYPHVIEIHWEQNIWSPVSQF